VGAQAGKLTEAQRAALIERYLAGESMTRLGPEFGVTRQAIGGLLRRRGIPVRPQAKLTDLQRVEAVERYIRGQTCDQIGADFGVSGVAILDVLNRHGVTIRRRCIVRHDALDEIMPESAYWCGFLFADGNVHRRSMRQQPVLSVGVAARDLQQIVKLRSFLGSSHKICIGNKRHPSYQFHVASNQLCQRLCSLGRYEGQVSPELVNSRHFWRGLADGDGSLGCYAKRPGSKPSAQFRLCGERRLLLAFTHFLRADGTTGANLTVRPHKSIYSVGTTGWSAARIVQLLYEDAPVALDRKADTARLIITMYRRMMAGRVAAAIVSGQKSGLRGRVGCDGLP
jgi:hypothetical protein